MNKKLQVFISSTFIDLKEERQAAVSAILKAGHIPAGMELFKAADKSQWEIIKRWIDESDVYMLILGGRYGSIDPKTGVSYTELEYDYAVETNKPLFAVVIEESAIEEKVRIKGLDFLERERPSELKLFKEKVLQNMSSFFHDLKDIRLTVMESLPEIAQSHNLSGWVSGGEIPDFQSLISEIDELRKNIKTLEQENNQLRFKKETVSSSYDFEELEKILKAIEVSIPTNVSGKDENFKLSLFTLFERCKTTLVTGVTNKINQDETTSFLYFNICPKLQIHGLVENEKVASVQYRRFAITKKGIEFLAFLEKQKVLESV
jgi:hypothetical protein